MIVSPNITNLQSVRNQLILTGQNLSSGFAVHDEANHGLPDKLLLDVYKLADFRKGSSNHLKWLVKPFVI